MTSWLIGPLRGVTQVLVGADSSRQIAAGVAIGVVLGLLPKMTLLAFALGFALCALRVNKAAGLVAAGAMALLAPTIDPLLHTVGLKVLGVASFQPAFIWLYEAPLGPWLGFHNTVGMGALLAGVYLAYPAYLVTRSLVDRVRPKAAAWIARYRIARVLLGADVATRLGTLR